MADKYTPTNGWFDAAWGKIALYKKVRSDKDYARADSLRKELFDMGFTDLDAEPRWHPVFESKDSRYARLKDI